MGRRLSRCQYVQGRLNLQDLSSGSVRFNLIHKEKLPTNLTTNRHPIHRWFNFIAGFSPEFVSWCIGEANLGVERKLIDPFAGLSTALVQANLVGIPSVGFEPHPFFYDISSAKLFPPFHRQEVDAIEVMSRVNVKPYPGKLEEIWTKDAVSFLLKLIPEPDLRLLASARLVETELEPIQRPLYRLIISRVLEFTARSQTDGIYKAPTTYKIPVPYQIAVQKVCEEIREDVLAVGNIFSRQATLHLMSSEAMTPVGDESCSLCVTSPPYLNNFDFAEMTRMELYFWCYAGSWHDITEGVRRRLIVNTTTAPTDLKRDQDRFSVSLSKDFRFRLQPLIDALRKQQRVRAGKKDYYLLVYPYFSQIQSVFRELRRVLKAKSPFHLVVADAALYGVHIQTEQLLAQLMEENGFNVLSINNLRSRGDRWVLEKRQGANKRLGEFHIHAVRA